ncbi:hypothetical protein [Bartonella tribocorum]
MRRSYLVPLAFIGSKGRNKRYHLDRGFERLEEKLMRCDAKIQRLTA